MGGAFLSVAYYPHMYLLVGFFTAAQLMYEINKHGTEEVVEPKKPEWYENDPVNTVWQDEQGSPEKPETGKS